MKRVRNAPYPYYDIPELWTIRELTDNGREKGRDVTVFYRGRHNDIPVTFGECSSLTEQLGTFLLSQGHEAAHLAIIGENSTEWVLSFLAVTCSGNVAVPVDRALPLQDIAELAEHSECSAVFYSDGSAPVIDHLKSLGGRFSGISYYQLSKVYEYADEGRELIDDGNRAFSEAGERINRDTPASIVYTSGTSGKMKGVMLSHGNITSDVVATCMCAEADHAQLLLPLHHTFSWASAMLAAFLYIKDLHISGNLRHIVKDFQTNHPQNVAAVPMMAEMLHKGIWNTARSSGQEDRLRRGVAMSRALMKIGIDMRRSIFRNVHDNFGGELELIICGGAHLDEEVEKGLRDLGIEVLCGYGITECSPVVAVNRNHDHRYGSVGKPLPCNRVRIDEPDENGIGEILVSGSNVMLGYYKDPEATAEAFDGEWFRTGDYGRIDSDGFLYLTGRKKNLIILANGENVSPEEIEEKLLKIGFVKEVVVYEENGVITGEIFLDKESYPDADERLDDGLKAFNRKMPPSKRIGKVKTRDIPFEKTTTMKIKRYLVNSDGSGNEEA